MEAARSPCRAKSSRGTQSSHEPVPVPPGPYGISYIRISDNSRHSLLNQPWTWAFSQGPSLVTNHPYHTPIEIHASPSQQHKTTTETQHNECFTAAPPDMCRFSVPEEAPFTAVLKFAAEEVGVGCVGCSMVVGQGSGKDSLRAVAPLRNVESGMCVRCAWVAVRMHPCDDAYMCAVACACSSRCLPRQVPSSPMVGPASGLRPDVCTRLPYIPGPC